VVFRHLVVDLGPWLFFPFLLRLYTVDQVFFSAAPSTVVVQHRIHLLVKCELEGRTKQLTLKISFFGVNYCFFAILVRFKCKVLACVATRGVFWKLYFHGRRCQIRLVDFASHNCILTIAIF